MSRMTVKSLDIGVGTEEIKEFRNAWGGAPYVWDIFMPNWLSRPDDLAKLWSEARNPNRTDFERIVLALTFDHAYVSRDNFQRAAEDIERFLTAHPPKPENVNHWQDVADLLRSTDANAICFHHTSVSEDPWRGAWNEELEDYDPPNWSDAFEVYADLRPRFSAETR